MSSRVARFGNLFSLSDGPVGVNRKCSGSVLQVADAAWQGRESGRLTITSIATNLT